jgi:RNA polymerase sigma-70 factor (ECF subfamily)
VTLVGVNDVKSDKEKLRQLYEQHGRGLIAYSCTFLRGFAVAEDILHQVFERLLRGNIQLTDTPAPYLYRAVRNASLNYMRDRSRDAELPDDWLESPAGMDDAGLVLQSALRELPEEQREMIVLRIWGRMSFEEAAETIGISPKTAESRYRYGLQKLRAQFNPMADRKESHGFRR